MLWRFPLPGEQSITEEIVGSFWPLAESGVPALVIIISLLHYIILYREGFIQFSAQSRSNYCTQSNVSLTRHS